MEITKEQFLKAYNKYPPSNWLKFVFKYFSRKVKPEDKWLSRIVQYSLGALFIWGFVGTVLDLSRILILIPTVTLGVILVLVALIMGSGFFLNNYRIRKIRKELGWISKQEYNRLADMYFDIV